MGWFSWLKPKPKFRPSTTQELVQYFNGDIIKISQWIGDNVWYYKDTLPEHNWQRANDTLKRLKGDCEDFAVLYSRIFSMLQWEHMIMCGYPKRGTGHAICVVETPKGYAYTSNDLFILSGEKNAPDVVRDAMPNMVIYRHTDVLGITIESYT